MVSNTSSLREDWNELLETGLDWGANLGLPTSVAAKQARRGIIPGDPDTLAEMAEHFRALGSAFERSGRGFRAIDTGGWQGEAAEAAREYLEQSPRKWFDAADAFTEAGDALSRYEQVLRQAQQRAEAAQRDLAEAARRAKDAAEEHNRRVEQARQEGAEPPPPFEDPTAEQREAARSTIERARREVDDAAADAAARISSACQTAPDKPGWLARTRQTVVDGFQQAGRVLGSVVEGIGSGLSGMAKGLWTFNPTHPWNQTHPAAFAARMYDTAEAITTSPYQTLKTSIGIDTWKNDPGKATGEMIPGLVSSAAGGGGLVAKGASAASRAARAARGLDNVPTGGARVPDGTPHGPNTPGQNPSRSSQGPPTP
ncbi:putative T7SS-secreted protein, partial [Actinopolyspora mortivallis]